MRRFVILMTAVCTLLGGAADFAHAQGKRKKSRAAAAAPTSARIAKDLDHITWGMSMKEVVRTFNKKIDEKYRPLIAKANTAMKEDRLRSKKRAELQKIHDSAVRFDGTATGWDVSFLKGEFTHGNTESLLVIQDANSQNFYFFIQDKLWKWYKAFDAKVFEGADFSQFAQAIQSRYGKGVRRKGEVTQGAGERKWLEWQDKKTRLRAVDQTGFYGFYCLVFEDKGTLGRLAKLRTAQPKQGKDTHHLVEHVTTGDTTQGDDAHQDVADRITGRIRRREDQPKGKKAAPAKKKRSVRDDALGDL